MAREQMTSLWINPRYQRDERCLELQPQTAQELSGLQHTLSSGCCSSCQGCELSAPQPLSSHYTQQTWWRRVTHTECENLRSKSRELKRTETNTKVTKSPIFLIKIMVKYFMYTHRITNTNMVRCLYFTVTLTQYLKNI